ncbi:MAG: hypothetical protein FRX49_10664 [Trebouxia sp. A1-2]|nr:MAG: hypothetical protein FRX49_10664 [Trebouxia sp. A1-2]
MPHYLVSKGSTLAMRRITVIHKSDMYKVWDGVRQLNARVDQPPLSYMSLFSLGQAEVGKPNLPSGIKAQGKPSTALLTACKDSMSFKTFSVSAMVLRRSAGAQEVTKLQAL